MITVGNREATTSRGVPQGLRQAPFCLTYTMKLSENLRIKYFFSKMYADNFVCACLNRGGAERAMKIVAFDLLPYVLLLIFAFLSPPLLPPHMQKKHILCIPTQTYF